MNKTLLLPAAFALSIAACSGGAGGGDDDDDGGSFSDDGGTGTGTLRIVAALSVDPDGNFLANVNVADDQSTVVSGATVTLKTPDQGDILLVEQPVGFGTYVLPGTYDYSSGFGLDVDGGADGNATGIGFSAPDLTAITAPQNQDLLPINQDMTVTWAGRGADEHRLELTVNDYDSGWVDGDTGADVIVAANVTTASTETLTVRRRKEIDITSGRAGSVFKVELEDVIEPLGLQ